MLTPYSRSKVPPAPILQIRLSPPSMSAATNALPALIDTGSDFSLVPLDWLLRIDAPESRAAYVRGLWSAQREITLYFVDIHLEQGTLPGVEVIGVADDDIETEEDLEIILGRNVLNKLVLLLDGPHEQTEIAAQRPARLS